MLVQAMAGVNSMVVTSWILVFFRDSFDTMQETYKWNMCQRTVPAFYQLRKCDDSERHLVSNSTGHHGNIEETIPDYFAATVLQRSLPIYPPNFESWFGSLKFQVVFNLVVIWMIVFICLSRGKY